MILDRHLLLTRVHKQAMAVSGICGGTQVRDPLILRAMGVAQVQGRPNRAHVDRAAAVGLGVRCIGPIEMERNNEPVSNEDGSIWGVLNGAIYNRTKLTQLLQMRGHHFRSSSDTEVLVHLYEEYGTDLVHAIEGMYAFAVWDTRSQRLLIARDRFGEEPLFYAVRGGNLWFASELTGLQSAGVSDGELDEEALDAYFVLGCIPAPATILRGVSLMLPGELISWDRSSRRVSLRRYWEPPPLSGRRSVPTDLPIAETHDLLKAAVLSRMLPEAPSGFLLRGGIGSILVAALAARSGSAPIKTFGVGCDAADMSELRWARQVASVLATDHQEMLVTANEVKERAPRLLASLDQPLADAGLVAMQALSECARDEVTVALGGQGADELFGGLPFLRWRHRGDERTGMIQRLRTGSLNLALARRPSVGAHFRRLTAWRAGLRPYLYGQRLREKCNGSRDVLQPAATDAAEDVRLVDLEQRIWLPDDTLAGSQRASSSVFLEHRSPYLDRSLAEFACTLPVELHRRGAGHHLLRGVLKEVLGGAMPVPRGNTDGAPAGLWLRGPMAAVLRDQMQGGPLIGEGWIDRESVATLLREHLGGARDWTPVLWALLALSLWLQRFRGTDG